MTYEKGKKKPNIDEKWQIYLETSAPGAQVGEILRKRGMYPAELTKISAQVEEGAKRRVGGGPRVNSREYY